MPKVVIPEASPEVVEMEEGEILRGRAAASSKDGGTSEGRTSLPEDAPKDGDVQAIGGSFDELGEL